VGLHVRTAPAILEIEKISQRVIGVLPARRCGVPGFAGAKLYSRKIDMQMVAVIDGHIVILLRVKSGGGQGHELIEDFPFLLSRRVVAGSPAYDGVAPPAFEGQ
jgi:hypothetical protein